MQVETTLFQCFIIYELSHWFQDNPWWYQHMGMFSVLLGVLNGERWNSDTKDPWLQAFILYVLITWMPCSTTSWFVAVTSGPVSSGICASRVLMPQHRDLENLGWVISWDTDLSLSGPLLPIYILSDFKTWINDYQQWFIGRVTNHRWSYIRGLFQ